MNAEDYLTTRALPLDFRVCGVCLYAGGVLWLFTHVLRAISSDDASGDCAGFRVRNGDGYCNDVTVL
jgi:hypothetical protein